MYAKGTTDLHLHHLDNDPIPLPWTESDLHRGSLPAVAHDRLRREVARRRVLEAMLLTPSTKYRLNGRSIPNASRPFRRVLPDVPLPYCSCLGYAVQISSRKRLCNC